MTKQTHRKRFQVRKFLGELCSVIDVVKNATVATFSSRQEAKSMADEMNAIEETQNG